MKKIVMSVLAALLVTTCLNAESVKGTYFGLGYGSSIYDDGGYLDDLKRNRDRVSPSTGITENYSSSGYKIYGGYQFNKIIAVEASYAEYGTYSLDFSNGNNKEMKPTAIAVAANIGYNFGTKKEFRPFAIIGLSALNINDTGNVDFYDNNSGSAIRFGLGFEYTPEVLQGIGFRVAYEGDYFSSKTPSNADSEFEDSYFQSMNMYYVSVQYNSRIR
ncbi:outer membrane beta-barrel protein [Sulfurimonas sp.]|uniref:outer membrane beta-barrel protein n=1 Tax=Sulfurimonas sp. TaxID=2022749 RepID=UPI0025F7E862|nr:outer membrane beta-barrel protein [Sulfurimonas sp.]